MYIAAVVRSRSPAHPSCKNCLFNLRFIMNNELAFRHPSQTDVAIINRGCSFIVSLPLVEHIWNMIVKFWFCFIQTIEPATGVNYQC